MDNNQLGRSETAKMQDERAEDVMYSAFFLSPTSPTSRIEYNSAVVNCILRAYLDLAIDHMFETTSTSDRNLAIQRLTALWALNECGLGGVLHAFNSPFTGLLVGSFAMICIAFICALADNKWKTIMTSLFVVLVIKALVSPHSSPTAYIAVIFQGVTGALIYRFIPNLLVSSIIFLSLGLIESALQRLFTLTVLYGNTLWEAINIWGEWVAAKWGVLIPVSSSKIIIYTYLSIHLLVGFIIGWLTYKTIKSVHAQWGLKQYALVLGKEDTKSLFKHKKKKSWRRFIFFFVLVAIIILAYSGLPDSDSNIQQGLLAIIRACAVLTLWFVFLAPLMIRLLRKYLNKKHQQLSLEVSQTMDMFPHLLWIIDKAWNESKSLRFFQRLKLFLLHTLLYILQYRTADDTDSNRTDKES